MIEIAVLGHGVVGSGVCELLEQNGSSIARRTGQQIIVKKILDLRDFPDCPYKDKFVKNIDVILSDPDIKVVVEVMGGVSPAFEFGKAALEAGKSLVTSNKELVATKGATLLKIAEEHNVNFLFEASVGGGIPIIRPLHQCLAANRIGGIAGILNGTTNFILTKMIKDGMQLADATLLAQQLGYAEANPAADVEGHDSCRKICILASIAFGSHVYPEYVHTQGITAITLEDVRYAESADRVIKLIGQAHQTPDGKVYALVSPALISRDSQLAGVDDVFNGILVHGDATGDVVFYGKGAGKLPTASAVVGDVIDCIKAKGTIVSLSWSDSDHDNVADYRDEDVRLYVRCTGAATATAMLKSDELQAMLEAGFGSGLHFLSRKGQPGEEFAFFTPSINHGLLEEALEALAGDGIKVLAAIPVLDY